MLFRCAAPPLCRAVAVALRRRALRQFVAPRRAAARCVNLFCRAATDPYTNVCRCACAAPQPPLCRCRRALRQFVAPPVDPFHCRCAAPPLCRCHCAAALAATCYAAPQPTLCCRYAVADAMPRRRYAVAVAVAPPRRASTRCRCHYPAPLPPLRRRRNPRHGRAPVRFYTIP